MACLKKIKRVTKKRQDKEYNDPRKVGLDSRARIRQKLSSIAKVISQVESLQDSQELEK